MHLLDKLRPPEATELSAELATHRYRWLSERYPNPRVPEDRSYYYQRGLANRPDQLNHPRLAHPDNVRAYEAGLLRQPNPYA